MIAYNDYIKSIGYDQHEMLYNIMRLHNNGEPFECDMTYSIGNFYGKFNITTANGEKREIEIPQPRYKYDVYPQLEEVEKIEALGSLPLDDNSLKSIVIDLPFVVSCGKSIDTPPVDEHGNRIKNNIITRRFACYYPVSDLLRSYKHWIEEAYRVLKDDGILVFKCQSCVSGGKIVASDYYSRLIADSIGFDCLDTFVLLAKNRLVSGKVKKQEHARSFHSFFIVFKKSLKRKTIYFDFLNDNEIDELFTGLRKNNINKKRKDGRKVKTIEETIG